MGNGYRGIYYIIFIEIIDMNLFKNKDFVTILISNISAITICVVLVAIDKEKYIALGILFICFGLLPSLFIALRDIKNRLKGKLE